MDEVKEALKKGIKNAMERSISKVHNYAATHHRFTTRTGALDRSIQSEVTNGGLHGSVWLDTRIAKYGPFVHQGTRAHIIRPRNKKALRWPGKGGFVFSKVSNHPGIKKDPFLYDALDATSKEVDSIFKEEIDSVCDAIVETFKK